MKIAEDLTKEKVLCQRPNDWPNVRLILNENSLKIELNQRENFVRINFKMNEKTCIMQKKSQQ